METFQNENYKIEAERAKGCRLSMRVFISPEETRKAYKAAVKKVNKQISVPGFRKGRAPDETVLAKYGSYVDQEWKDILIQEGVQHALDISKIYPMKRGLDARPKIALCSVEEGSEINFSYECYPEVPEVDFSKLKIPSFEKKKIGQKEIEGVLEEVRKAYANWEELAKEEGEEGEYATVTVHTLDPEIALINNRRVPLDKNLSIPWLYDAIIDMKKGEIKEIPQSENPEKKLRVTLHSFWKILLPEVNEELAKKCGALNLEDLYAKIRHNLEKEAEAELKEKKFKALEEELLSQYSFDLPASFLEYEEKQRLKERLEQLKKAPLSSEEKLKAEQDLKKNIREETVKNLSLYFLRQKIKNQGRLEVSQEDLQAGIMLEMKANPLLFQQGMNKENSERFLTTLRENLMEGKIREYALAQLELTL